MHQDGGNRNACQVSQLLFFKHGLIMQLRHNVGQGYSKKVSRLSLSYHRPKMMIPRVILPNVTLSNQMLLSLTMLDHE